MFSFTLYLTIQDATQFHRQILTNDPTLAVTGGENGKFLHNPERTIKMPPYGHDGNGGVRMHSAIFRNDHVISLESSLDNPFYDELTAAGHRSIDGQPPVHDRNIFFRIAFRHFSSALITVLYGKYAYMIYSDMGTE
jgi:hypothetical protein